MNQDKDAQDPGHDNVDPGDPIVPLADLGQDVSPQFLRSLRKRIYRRTAANQMMAFSWNLPKVILMEMIMLIAHFFTGASKAKAKL